MKQGFFTELKKIYASLEGNKTFIVAGIIAGATFAWSVGWITKEEYEGFMGFLVSAGFITTRIAIKKLE